MDSKNLLFFFLVLEVRDRAYSRDINHILVHNHPRVPFERFDFLCKFMSCSTGTKSMLRDDLRMHRGNSVLKYFFKI